MARRKNFRTDCTLGKLPEARQEQIADWVRNCKEGDRYQNAADQLAADGIIASRSSVARWYVGWCLRQEFSAADAIASQIENSLLKEFPDATPEKLGAAGQAAFTAIAMANQDTKTFMDLESLRLAKETAATKGRQKDQDLKLSARRVKLLEEKASEAKAKLTQIAAKGGLSEETLREIEEAAKLL